jgi:hypothetical protein
MRNNECQLIDASTRDLQTIASNIRSSIATLNLPYKVGTTPRPSSQKSEIMSGAEIFLIGPLTALATFLSKWAIRKYHSAKQEKEDKYETQHLLAAVQRLSEFINARADKIAQFHLDLNLHPSSLRNPPAYFFLVFFWCRS